MKCNLQLNNVLVKYTPLLIYALNIFYDYRLDEALGELQYSFICFLVGQNYDAFEKWKQLLRMFCTSDEALAGHTLLYMTLISDLHFQVKLQNINHIKRL